jgi:hypothetical protein
MLPYVRGGTSSALDSVMNGGLRRLDRWCPDGAAQERQVEKAGGSHVGPDGGARSASGNTDDPAEHRCRQNRHDQSANR